MLIFFRRNKTLQMKIVFASIFWSASTSFSVNSLPAQKTQIYLILFSLASLQFLRVSNVSIDVCLCRKETIQWNNALYTAYYFSSCCQMHLYIQNRYEKHQSCSLVNDCLCCCCLLQCIRCWYVMHKTIQCIKMLALITKNALLNAHRCAFERAIVDGIRNFNYYSSSRFEYFEYFFHVCRYYVRLSIEVEDGKEKHPKIFHTKHTSMV